MINNDEVCSEIFSHLNLVRGWVTYYDLCLCLREREDPRQIVNDQHAQARIFHYVEQVRQYVEYYHTCVSALEREVRQLRTALAEKMSEEVEEP